MTAVGWIVGILEGATVGDDVAAFILVKVYIIKIEQRTIILISMKAKTLLNPCGVDVVEFEACKVYGA